MTTKKRPAARGRASTPPRKAATNGDEAGRANVRRGLVEQEIYDHATRLFADRGFAGTSFQDIADAVGLTRPALYHYVSSKDDLLAKLVAEFTEDAATGMAAIAKRTDLGPADKVREVIKATVRRQAEHTERFKLLIRSEAVLPEDVAAKHESGRRSVLKSLSGIIESGVGDGTFRPLDPRLAALGLLGMSNWVAWWYHPDERHSLDGICEEFADMAVASLINPDDRVPDGDGPQGVLRMVRQDLDRLERLLES